MPDIIRDLVSGLTTSTMVALSQHVLLLTSEDEHSGN